MATLKFTKAGRPRGWVISVLVLFIVLALVIIGCFNDGVMNNLLKMENLLMTALGVGGGGMTFKGLFTALESRSGGSPNETGGE